MKSCRQFLKYSVATLDKKALHKILSQKYTTTTTTAIIAEVIAGTLRVPTELSDVSTKASWMRMCLKVN